MGNGLNGKMGCPIQDCLRVCDYGTEDGALVAHVKSSHFDLYKEYGKTSSTSSGSCSPASSEHSTCDIPDDVFSAFHDFPPELGSPLNCFFFGGSAAMHSCASFKYIISLVPGKVKFAKGKFSETSSVNDLMQQDFKCTCGDPGWHTWIMIPIDDGDDAVKDFQAKWNAFIGFILEHSLFHIGQNNVLVHCNEGRNRSVTFLILLLMYLNNQWNHAYFLKAQAFFDKSRMVATATTIWIQTVLTQVFKIKLTSRRPAVVSDGGVTASGDGATTATPPTFANGSTGEGRQSLCQLDKLCSIDGVEYAINAKNGILTGRNVADCLVALTTLQASLQNDTFIFTHPGWIWSYQSWTVEKYTKHSSKCAAPQAQLVYVSLPDQSVGVQEVVPCSEDTDSISSPLLSPCSSVDTPPTKTPGITYKVVLPCFEFGETLHWAFLYVNIRPSSSTIKVWYIDGGTSKVSM